MLKNISKLGRNLSKSELQSIRGGDRYQTFCNASDGSQIFSEYAHSCASHACGEIDDLRSACHAAGGGFSVLRWPLPGE